MSEILSEGPFGGDEFSSLQKRAVAERNIKFYCLSKGFSQMLSLWIAAAEEMRKRCPDLSPEERLEMAFSIVAPSFLSIYDEF